MRQHSKATRVSPKYVEPKQTKNLRDEIMCYEIEVLEYNEDKAIITVGESKFIAYHDTECVCNGIRGYGSSNHLSLLLRSHRYRDKQ